MPNSNLDHDLQDIKLQYQQKQTPQPTPLQPQNPPSHDPLQAIKAQYQNQQSKQHLDQPNNSPLDANNRDDPLSQIKYQIQHQYQKIQQIQPKPSTTLSTNATDTQLQQLKQNYQHTNSPQPPADFRQNLTEICRTEQQKQQQKKQAIAQAQTWLKQLDPYSDEGIWFSQFATTYSTPLDAAIDYLNALQNFANS